MELILDLNGGACIQLNNMMKLVLENLGFDTFLVAAEAPLPGIQVPWNHAVTVVKLGEKTYLIDIGFARPIAEPINLSSLPYRTKEGGYEVEVRFHSEKNQYERVLLNGCPLTGSMVRFFSIILSFTCCRCFRTNALISSSFLCYLIRSLNTLTTCSAWSPGNLKTSKTCCATYSQTQQNASFSIAHYYSASLVMPAAPTLSMWHSLVERWYKGRH